jgi:hypothetical protein
MSGWYSQFNSAVATADRPPAQAAGEHDELDDRPS